MASQELLDSVRSVLAVWNISEEAEEICKSCNYDPKAVQDRIDRRLEDLRPGHTASAWQETGSSKKLRQAKKPLKRDGHETAPASKSAGATSSGKQRGSDNVSLPSPPPVSVSRPSVSATAPRKDRSSTRQQSESATDSTPVPASVPAPLPLANKLKGVWASPNPLIPPKTAATTSAPAATAAPASSSSSSASSSNTDLSALLTSINGLQIVGLQATTDSHSTPRSRGTAGGAQRSNLVLQIVGGAPSTTPSAVDPARQPLLDSSRIANQVQFGNFMATVQKPANFLPSQYSSRPALLSSPSVSPPAVDSSPPSGALSELASPSSPLLPTPSLALLSSDATDTSLLGGQAQRRGQSRAPRQQLLVKQDGTTQLLTTQPVLATSDTSQQQQRRTTQNRQTNRAVIRVSSQGQQYDQQQHSSQQQSERQQQSSQQQSDALPLESDVGAQDDLLIAPPSPAPQSDAHRGSLSPESAASPPPAEFLSQSQRQLAAGPAKLPEESHFQHLFASQSAGVPPPQPIFDSSTLLTGAASLLPFASQAQQTSAPQSQTQQQQQQQSRIGSSSQYGQQPAGAIMASDFEQLSYLPPQPMRPQFAQGPSPSLLQPIPSQSYSNKPGSNSNTATGTINTAPNNSLLGPLGALYNNNTSNTNGVAPSSRTGPASNSAYTGNKFSSATTTSGDNSPQGQGQGQIQNQNAPSQPQSQYKKMDGASDAASKTSQSSPIGAPYANRQQQQGSGQQVPQNTLPSHDSYYGNQSYYNPNSYGQSRYAPFYPPAGPLGAQFGPYYPGGGAYAPPGAQNAGYGYGPYYGPDDYGMGAQGMPHGVPPPGLDHNSSRGSFYEQNRSGPPGFPPQLPYGADRNSGAQQSSGGYPYNERNNYPAYQEHGRDASGPPAAEKSRPRAPSAPYNPQNSYYSQPSQLLQPMQGLGHNGGAQGGHMQHYDENANYYPQQLGYDSYFPLDPQSGSSQPPHSHR